MIENERDKMVKKMMNDVKNDRYVFVRGIVTCDIFSAMKSSGRKKKLFYLSRCGRLFD